MFCDGQDVLARVLQSSGILQEFTIIINVGCTEKKGYRLSKHGWVVFSPPCDFTCCYVSFCSFQCISVGQTSIIRYIILSPAQFYYIEISLYGSFFTNTR